MNTGAYPVPLSYNTAGNGGVGHYAAKISGKVLQEIVRKMRTATTGDDNFGLFREFFFVLWSNGLKIQVARGQQEEVLNTMNGVLRHLGVDAGSPNYAVENMYCLDGSLGSQINKSYFFLKL